MKHLILFIILLKTILASMGCTYATPYNGFKPGDDVKMGEVNTYTQEFESVYKSLPSSATKYSYRIVQSMDDLAYLGPNIIGVCWWRSDGTRDIQYDRTWWSKLTDLQKKDLVFHERGHCALSRYHRCDDISAGVKSIMYPGMADDWSLSITGRFDYLEAELFNQANQSINNCLAERINRQYNGDVVFMDVVDNGK
jgi:hypothetical protein